jgi:hypothetical protein
MSDPIDGKCKMLFCNCMFFMPKPEIGPFPAPVPFPRNCMNCNHDKNYHEWFPGPCVVSGCACQEYKERNGHCKTCGHYKDSHVLV